MAEENKNQPGSTEENSGENTGENSASGTQTLIRPESETKTPAMYRVIILNDDFTPRDFVVHILVSFFQKSDGDANQLMLQVHHQGSGVAGVFTYEIAETKSYQVNNYARQHQFPLKCIVEAV